MSIIKVGLQDRETLGSRKYLFYSEVLNDWKIYIININNILGELKTGSGLTHNFG